MPSKIAVRIYSHVPSYITMAFSEVAVAQIGKHELGKQNTTVLDMLHP